MPLTEAQKELIDEYTETILRLSQGHPESPEAAELQEYLTATEARRLEMLKAWATRAIAEDEKQVADWTARKDRATTKRDARKPILDSIETLTRLTDRS